ncbi:sensor histidine kinase [Luteirhabdus pelagi]|uniref:sensor histidine kinase n=1 Tax=Luteirhabdus pelagi TaxID=2792783 RepID=UPI001F1C99A2|nr:histidine kinase [Luteirhabdus pelagi]
MSKEERLLILYFIIVLVFAIGVVIVLFITFQRRKNKLLLNQLAQKAAYEEEISRTKVEIQEQTLKNIAWELHDNIGQLLSVTNIQLNMLHGILPSEFQQPLNETRGIVKDTVKEVRNLSKTLNNDVISKNGLVPSLEVELERYDRLNFLKTTFMVEGEEVSLPGVDEIIIFRILQEFSNNTLKHAKATTLSIHLKFTPQNLEIMAADNGVGFDTSKISLNSGMETMQSRAQLLNASYSLTSIPNQGTKLSLTYPYKDETNR